MRVPSFLSLIVSGSGARWLTSARGVRSRRITEEHCIGLPVSAAPGRQAGDPNDDNPAHGASHEPSLFITKIGFVPFRLKESREPSGHHAGPALPPPSKRSSPTHAREPAEVTAVGGHRVDVVAPRRPTAAAVARGTRADSRRRCAFRPVTRRQRMVPQARGDGPPACPVRPQQLDPVRCRRSQQTAVGRPDQGRGDREDRRRPGADVDDGAPDAVGRGHGVHEQGAVRLHREWEVEIGGIGDQTPGAAVHGNDPERVRRGRRNAVVHRNLVRRHPEERAVPAGRQVVLPHLAGAAAVRVCDENSARVTRLRHVRQTPSVRRPVGAEVDASYRGGDGTGSVDEMQRPRTRDHERVRCCRSGSSRRE